jgi:hypothetical protein
METSPRFAIRTFSNTAGEYCGLRTATDAHSPLAAAIAFEGSFLLLTGTAARGKKPAMCIKRAKEKARAL